MHSKESMDLGKKIKQFGKDYHNGAADEKPSTALKSKNVPDLHLYWAFSLQLFLYSSSSIPGLWFVTLYKEIIKDGGYFIVKKKRKKYVGSGKKICLLKVVRK